MSKSLYYVTEYVICNLEICFWDITQRMVKMEPKVGPETSVMNYRYTLRDVPEKVQISSAWRRKHEMSRRLREAWKEFTDLPDKRVESRR